MVGNSTSTRMKGGKRQYYVCGGYLRKGKQFCSYTGWSKERVEEIVTTKLRIALMRLLITENLEKEMRQFFTDNNGHKLTEKANLDAEISFLVNRVKLIELDIRTGKSKSYHQDMLAEMQSELHHKQNSLIMLSETIKDINVPEAFLNSIRYDIQTLIGLFDQDIPSPQLLHILVTKFISNLYIQRETTRLYLVIQFKHEEVILFEKTLVSEWR